MHTPPHTHAHRHVKEIHRKKTLSLPTRWVDPRPTKVLFFIAVLKTEPRASCILDKYFTTSYTPSLASEFLLELSNFSVQNHLEGLGSALEVLVEQVCTRAQDLAFLTDSQVLLAVTGQEPYLRP